MEIEMNEVEEEKKRVADLKPRDVFLLNSIPHMRVRLDVSMKYSPESTFHHSGRSAVFAVNLREAEVIPVDPDRVVTVPVVAKMNIAVAHLR